MGSVAIVATGLSIEGRLRAQAGHFEGLGWCLAAYA